MEVPMIGAHVHFTSALVEERVREWIDKDGVERRHVLPYCRLFVAVIVRADEESVDLLVVDDGRRLVKDVRFNESLPAWGVQAAGTWRWHDPRNYL
jgi:hypothetical protein